MTERENLLMARMMVKLLMKSMKKCEKRKKEFSLKKASFYNKKCQAEITAMKKHKFEGTLITYYDLYKDPPEVAARYMRNAKIVKEFESKSYETLYPMYGFMLRRNFKDALARAKSIERVSMILSETLNFADPSFEVFEKIFEYLSEDDVERIISGAKIVNF